MESQTRRIMYATKLKAAYWNLTAGRSLVRDLKALDTDSVKFLTDMVNGYFLDKKPVDELAEIIAFYTSPVFSEAKQLLASA